MNVDGRVLDDLHRVADELGAALAELAHAPSAETVMRADAALALARHIVAVVSVGIAGHGVRNGV
ncbi:hypothetical protein DWG18_06870 [Lysobacter sp. TY2-98]|uniref:hypothetical protein n=1 Tax=Lysobacter sp. TY2-98 TaxID=2290922 RepID=UPI000E1FED7C|nr:hypothetical protein [Lysobacter sp. TY2-98]AXK72030.1 hypothetical protein DWG18_06870 [Lysobacter sp. TY2-98]